MTETPIATTDGVSRQRDRTWGLIGSALGVAVGVGSAAIAIFVEGANAFESTVPYPRFFTKRELLTYDIFLAVVIAAGAVFGISAVILGRRSRFPRTDAVGGALCATVLLVLGSTLLFNGSSRSFGALDRRTIPSVRSLMGKRLVDVDVG